MMRRRRLPRRSKFPAVRANTPENHLDSQNFEALRLRFGQVGLGQVALKVHHPLAALTYQVVVWTSRRQVIPHLAGHGQRPNLPNPPQLAEGVIHRGERNTRHLVPHILVHFFGAQMPVAGVQRGEHRETLWGDSQTV